MKTETKFMVGLGLIVVLLLFSWGYEYGRSHQMKKTIGLMTEQREVKIVELEDCLRLMQGEMNTLLDKAVTAQKAAEELHSTLTREREANKREREARLAAMPPQGVVDETRRILNTEEVWIVATNIEMTEAAARLNLSKLMDGENFVEVERPAYESTITQLKVSNAEYKQAVLKAQEMLNVQDSIKKVKDEIIGDVKTYVKEVESSARKKFVLYFLGGIVAGGGLVLIAK
jgi:hypothetical protein